MTHKQPSDFAPESRPEDLLKWDMSQGDPELQHYMTRMAKIGGRVLDLIEAQIPAQQFRELGFQEGETLVVSPRKARVFLQPA